MKLPVSGYFMLGLSCTLARTDAIVVSCAETIWHVEAGLVLNVSVISLYYFP